MACRTDVRMLAELRRGELAFQNPAPGFNVIEVSKANLQPSDNKYCLTPYAYGVNVSEIAPTATWMLAAVRNMSNVSVDIDYYCGNQVYGDEWLNVQAYPARPVAALAGRYALPCRAQCGSYDRHASQYHNCWLLVGCSESSDIDSVRLELLTCERDPSDDSELYTNAMPGVAIPKYKECQWRSGMMGLWGRELTSHPWRLHDVDLLRKARWAHDYRQDEDAGSLGRELILSPNQASKNAPAEHWQALRDFGARLNALLGKPTLDDITPQFRQDWNSRFSKFGKQWTLLPKAQLSLDECKKLRLAEAQEQRWWSATDLTGILQNQAARRLQKAFKASLSDPSFAVCRRRLLREFQTCLADKYALL